MNLSDRTNPTISFWLNVKKVQQVCNLTHWGIWYLIYCIDIHFPNTITSCIATGEHQEPDTGLLNYTDLETPDELISLATGELWVVQVCFTMYKHLKSVVSFVVKPLRIGNSTQVIFCRVVLLFSVQLLSARDNCLFQMSVVPFIFWHTLDNVPGTRWRPCRWTWQGIAGTVALTGPGIRSRQGLVLLLQLRAVAAAHWWSSIEALRSPYVALRRSCVLCAHDTWEPLLCSLCLLPAEDSHVHTLLGLHKPTQRRICYPKKASECV